VIEPPEIVETNAQAAAVIRVTTPRDRIQEVMEPAIHEVIDAVSEQGVGPAGPVFAHYLSMPTDEFDFEVGVPVSGPVRPTGRMVPGQLPAATVARTVYRGPYEGLHEAWREFGERAERELGERLQAEGLRPGATLWERYVSGPESSPDPGAWRTALNRPLVRAEGS
jgi:effector-binding domain-containing protein